MAPALRGIGLAESPLAMRSQKSRKPRSAPRIAPPSGSQQGAKAPRGAGNKPFAPFETSFHRGFWPGAHRPGARWFRMNRPVSCRSPRRSPGTKALSPAHPPLATFRGARPGARTAGRAARTGRDPVPCRNFLRMGGTERARSGPSSGRFGPRHRTAWSAQEVALVSRSRPSERMHSVDHTEARWGYEQPKPRGCVLSRGTLMPPRWGAPRPMKTGRGHGTLAAPLRRSEAVLSLVPLSPL